MTAKLPKNRIQGVLYIEIAVYQVTFALNIRFGVNVIKGENVSKVKRSIYVMNRYVTTRLPGT